MFEIAGRRAGAAMRVEMAAAGGRGAGRNTCAVRADRAQAAAAAAARWRAMPGFTGMFAVTAAVLTPLASAIAGDGDGDPAGQGRRMGAQGQRALPVP